MNRVQQNFGATEKSFPVKLDDSEARNVIEISRRDGQVNGGDPKRALGNCELLLEPWYHEW